jgi:hypothetical protein
LLTAGVMFSVSWTLPSCGSGKFGTPLARMQREKATNDA